MNGKPVIEKGYGVANLASSAPATAATVYRIGSITKQFTASAIMLLVQEGRIKLDDKVSKYLPTAPASWNAITIRHLMQHTSGLPRDFPESLVDQVNPAALPGIDQLVALAAQFPLENATGAVHSYSNVGYHVLGFVIEKVSGQYFADFLQQRIFTPLGMTGADVIRTTKPVPAIATGYLWNGSAHRAASTLFLTPGYIEAEGNLQMSALDLAKWDAALLTERILTKASLAQMWAPAVLNNGATVSYGFGWSLGDANHHPYTWHNGAVEGFTSQFERHTQEGLSVIVLVNLDDSATTRIGAHVSAILKPELQWTTSTDPTPANGALVRSLIDEVRRGGLLVDERFSAQAKAELTADVVATMVNYFKTWAPIEQFGYVDQTTYGNITVLRYLVRSNTDELLLGVVFAADGKIAALIPLSE